MGAVCNRQKLVNACGGPGCTVSIPQMLVKGCRDSRSPDSAPQMIVMVGRGSASAARPIVSGCDGSVNAIFCLDLGI